MGYRSTRKHLPWSSASFILASTLMLCLAAHAAIAQNPECQTDEDTQQSANMWKQPGTWGKLIASFFLICCSALFSGLTLGLLSLDKLSLEIIQKSGDPKERKYAKNISPVRRRGNLLLCTLLLGNVMVNSAISILTSDLSSGLLGLVLSTLLISLFGEIIPQAACSRYALAVGGYTAWIVKILMIVMSPVAFPLSWVLDKVLAADIGTIYTKDELKKLIELHAQHEGTSGLAKHEAVILGGALEFAKKTVESAMTPLEDSFMLEVSERLDVDTMTAIWQTGHSRIPVYEGNKNHIIGLLFVKDLVLLNPEDAMPLRTIISFYGRELTRVFPDMTLDELLAIFKSGRSHMAIVHRVNSEGEGDPFYETVGIITLEDVIEEIIKSEIVDETDVFVDVHTRQRVKRKRGRMAFAKRGRSSRLTPQQVTAVGSYLVQTTAPFKLLSKDALRRLLGQSLVVDVNKGDEDLYERGKESKLFSLVLHGKLEVISGVDSFRSECGPWAFLGLRALTQANFVPDFSARILQQTRILRIWREDFLCALDDTLIEQNLGVEAAPSGFEWAQGFFVQRRVRLVANRKRTRLTQRSGGGGGGKTTSLIAGGGGGGGGGGGAINAPNNNNNNNDLDFSIIITGDDTNNNNNATGGMDTSSHSGDLSASVVSASEENNGATLGGGHQQQQQQSSPTAGVVSLMSEYLYDAPSPSAGATGASVYYRQESEILINETPAADSHNDNDYAIVNVATPNDPLSASTTRSGGNSSSSSHNSDLDYYFVGGSSSGSEGGSGGVADYPLVSPSSSASDGGVVLVDAADDFGSDDMRSDLLPRRY